MSKLLELADKLAIKAIDQHIHPTTGTIHAYEEARADIQEEIDKVQANANRWLWMWNNALHVSYTYQVNQYTKATVMGLHCNTLRESVDLSMKVRHAS